MIALNKNRINYFVLVFFIASLLLLILGFVNRESNDNHVEVMQKIIKENRIPNDIGDCWLCWHPKLYYLVGVAVFKLFNLSSNSTQIIAAQIINVIAGIVTLFFVYSFIKKISKNDKANLIIFTLIALNPKLIGIFAQSTNNGFAIMFATISIYFFDGFMNEPDTKSFLLTVLFTILSISSKTTTLPMLVSFILIFLVRLLINIKNSDYLKTYGVYFIAFLLIISLTAPLFGGYYNKYAKYGDPFKISVDPCTPPQLFTETTCNRPGVTSIFNSFFKFRIIDAIMHPYTGNGPDPNPLHRTSLWAQLYGRANYVQFDSWPPSWATNNPFIVNIGKIILILALVPLCIFFYGFIININNAFRGIIKYKGRYLQDHNGWFFVIIFLMYVAFTVYCSWRYRDFAFMKMDYIFPGLLSYVKILLDGLKKINELIKNKKTWNFVTYGLLTLLCAFYFVDVVCLIYQLV